MSLPFPGMDPYLEHPVLWTGVHARMIVWLAHQLNPLLRPRYVTSLEERVVVDGPDEQRILDLWVQRRRPGDAGKTTTLRASKAPFVVEVGELEIKQRYIEILDRYRELKVVCVIELVSPTNKGRGPGRRAYLKKQRETLASECHLVEIDLLRRGRHVLGVPRAKAREVADYHYLACVSRWPARRHFELYPWCLREPMPTVWVPLTEPDDDVPMDLRSALEQVYEDGSYMLRVRYEEPCEPSLKLTDQEWADQCWVAYRAAHPDLFPPTLPPEAAP